MANTTQSFATTAHDQGLILAQRYKQIIEMMLGPDSGKQEPLNHARPDVEGGIPWHDVRFRSMFAAAVLALRRSANEGIDAKQKWDGIKELAAVMGAAIALGKK